MPEVVHTTQFPALVHYIFLAVTVFPSQQPAKHRPAWRILVPIFMIQRCLHFVDTFEALIYYIRWYKLKKGGPTLSVDSPNIDQHKKSALLCSKALSGAPCGSKPEHFCVSGRHWHHAAAHPEVMPVVPPREDKRGVLKHQGAFAVYPRFANWAAVFHSPLDISPSLFFRLIAEQPTSPYPGGITESKIKHGTCLVQ